MDDLMKARAKLLAMHVHSQPYWGPVINERVHMGTLSHMTNVYHMEAYPASYYFHEDNENYDVLWEVARSLFGDDLAVEPLLNYYDTIMQPIWRNRPLPVMIPRTAGVAERCLGNLHDRCLERFESHRLAVLRELTNPVFDDDDDREEDGDDDNHWEDSPCSCCTPPRMKSKRVPIPTKRPTD